MPEDVVLLKLKEKAEELKRANLALRGDVKNLEEKSKRLQNRYEKLVLAINGYAYSMEVDCRFPIADGDKFRDNDVLERELNGSMSPKMTYGPGCEAVTGYTSSDYSIEPDLWSSIIHDDDRPWVSKRMEYIRTGNDEPFEYRIVRKDGSLRWVKNTPLVDYAADSTVTGYGGIVTDITGSKIFLEQSRNESAVVGSVIEGIDYPAYLKDTEGRYVLFNSAFCTFFGKTREELRGKTDMELLSPELAKSIMEVDGQVLAGGGTYVCTETLNVGNTVGVFMASRGIYRDITGKVAGIIGVFHEISASKQTQERPGVFGIQTKTVVDNLPIGVAYLDNDYRILDANRFVSEITGLKHEELVGKRCYDKIGEFANDETLVGMDKLCSCCTKDRCEKEGIPVVTECFWGDRYIRLTTIPEFDENGNTVSFLEIMEDITPFRKAEAKIVEQYQLQDIINKIFQVSLEPIPFEEQLKEALRLILSIPRLSLLASGCIFIVNDDDNTLSAKVHNFSSQQLILCGTVAIGTCVCGVAAQRGEIIFNDRIDEMHTLSYDGMPPHGHYAIPIKYNDLVIGVLTIYLREGHKRDYGEESILKTIANTLAGIIVRKRAEEILTEKEEHLRCVVQTAKSAIISVTGEGKTVLWNNAATSMFGYTTMEMIGNPITMLMPERYRDAHTGGLMRIAETIESGNSAILGKTVELQGRRKDGTEFPIELSIARWTARKGTFFTGIVRDMTRRNRGILELQQSLEKLRKLTGGIIQAMSAAVEAKDPYTAGHQRRVSDLARAIAHEMGLGDTQVECIRVASSIHDIGKIYVPAEILSKPGKLRDNEFSIIKDHPQIGYDILKGIEFPYPVAGIVLQHHEKINGTGYPMGLRGQEILLEARIICVADVVEAMANHRPYRPALGTDKALEEISGNGGILYDPSVVDACLKVFEKGFTFQM
ncbi:MAG: PAS domain S-box protein [Nitrospirae bacterium]|nr:PAS domain S-box protein [Nitrospirota bacterium]